MKTPSETFPNTLPNTLPSTLPNTSPNTPPNLLLNTRQRAAQNAPLKTAANTLFALRFSLLLLILSSCALTPPPTALPNVDHLFIDTQFKPPSTPINADEVFALNDEMKRFIRVEMARQIKEKGTQGGLFDALYSDKQLRLFYDSERTRNAAETFDTRSGNCLSLVIMTGAFAKELGLRVHYQRVLVDESWTRNSGIFFASGHVNLVLGTTFYLSNNPVESTQTMTIDFSPPEQTRAHRNEPISEQTIIAMYMNNRAAEALVRGQLDDAYWLVREAIKQDASFLIAYNTLGVIYRHHRNIEAAEQVFNTVLAIDHKNLQAMSNLALLLREQARFEEANLIMARLEKAQPFAPYYFFDQGQTAFQRGDYELAKTFFQREVKRDQYNHEFQFWLAVSYFKLGETSQAKKHMSKAMETSTTRKDHDLYAAKLDRLTAEGVLQRARQTTQ